MDCGFLNLFRAAADVGRLRERLELLNAIHNDINCTVQLAVQRSGWRKEPTNRVKGWLDGAQKAATEAEAVLAKHYDAAGRSCVDKMIRRVEDLLSQAPPSDALTTDAPPPSVQERSADVTVSGGPLDENFQEAMCFLREREEGVLGIWGIGGVGKTNLLTKINNSFLKDCTEEKLQQEMLLMLGGLPKGQQATPYIFNLLKGKKFALLIDDVWNTLDLTKVGIPHPLGSTDKLKRKVVLTTRSEDMCGMMQARSMIRVDRLPRDLAWTLFRKKVGEKTLNSHPCILQLKLAERLAEECGGLPLALTVVGCYMSTRRSPRLWDITIQSIQSSKHLIPGDNDEHLPQGTIARLWADSIQWQHHPNPRINLPRSQEDA